MKKISHVLASIALIAFLTSILTNPAFAQQKNPQQGTKRMSMMQKTADQPMQVQNKKMGMSGQMMMGKGMMQGNAGMMKMMQDPVMSALHLYGCPGFLLMNEQALNLTDQQKQKLNALKLEFKKKAIKTQADIKVETLNIKEIMNNDKPNFNKVKASVKKINTLQENLRSQFLNTLIKGRNVLNTKQLVTLKALASKGCKGMHGKGMMMQQGMMHQGMMQQGMMR